MDITELLAFSAKQGASDLHLSAGLPPMIRVDGDVRRINVPDLDHKAVHGLIYDIMNDKQRRDFEEQLETDFSFEVPSVARSANLGMRTFDQSLFALYRSGRIEYQTALACADSVNDLRLQIKLAEGRHREGKTRLDRAGLSE